MGLWDSFLRLVGLRPKQPIPTYTAPDFKPRTYATPTSQHGDPTTEAAHWRGKADASDERARRLRIDPPRPGRKSYAERQAETRAMSVDDIRASIAEREAAGKECGVLYRVLSEKLGK